MLRFLRRTAIPRKPGIVPEISAFHFSTGSPKCQEKSVRIGCASGFWGDTPTAVPQLLKGGKLDYLMFDYLSEVTMSLMTAAKAKKPEFGYAPDFVLFAVGPHLAEIKRQGVKIVANAGGINTEACVAALKEACKKAGVDLKIASVTGDDLMPLLKSNPDQMSSIKEMFSGQPLPAKAVHSMTAYYGAGPIVKALEMGADIVVTGRTADSALALAPCVYEHKWNLEQDWDKLAAGSLAGHLIECGGQATGGLFTDWEQVAPGYANLGFPFVDVLADGQIELGKPEGTGGILSVPAVAEQMLYEVGDPRNYMLPDVICDFTSVKMSKNADTGGILVSGAKGKPATESFKVSATYLDGFKASCVAIIGGGRAADKGRAVAKAIMKRSRAIFKHMKLDDFTKTHVTAIGSEDSFGANKYAGINTPRETALWMAVQHKDKKALDIWAREIASSGTGMAPGLCQMVGGRPKPSPCLKLFSFLYPKQSLPAKIQLDDQTVDYIPTIPSNTSQAQAESDPDHSKAETVKGNNTYTLEDLAYARSGDKGDSCNIGVIARHPSYLPYIREQLTPESVHKYFEHYIDTENGGCVRRYDVPGIDGFNFVLEKSLGGGGIASLRPDPLGKSFAQMLLSFELTDVPNHESLL